MRLPLIVAMTLVAVAGCGPSLDERYERHAWCTATLWAQVIRLESGMTVLSSDKEVADVAIAQIRAESTTELWKTIEEPEKYAGTRERLALRAREIGRYPQMDMRLRGLDDYVVALKELGIPEPRDGCPI